MRGFHYTYSKARVHTQQPRIARIQPRPARSCVIVRDNKIIAKGFNLTNELRNVRVVTGHDVPCWQLCWQVLAARFPVQHSYLC